MQTLLFLHNLLRWLLLLAGLYAIIRSITGVINKRAFTADDNRAQLFFVIFCHTQLLIGLILYFVSPVVQAARADMGTAMKVPELRFYAVEHIAVMILGIAMVQVGRSLSKKAVDPVAKHKKALIFFVIGMLLILSRIPWGRAWMPTM